jgi:SNF2 family DNA or RNA helicase
MDMFNIFRFLDKGETFGTNFWKFRNVWFEDENAAWSGRDGHYPKYVPRPETYKEFHSIVEKKAVRAKKSECLDLPPFVREEVFVELSGEQKRLHDQMRAEYIAYVDGLGKSGEPRAVVAQLAVTKALRLLQIITGYAKLENGEIYKIKDNPRLKALEELLEEHVPNHKIIVWSIFHENYDDIAGVCKKLKIPFGELHGRVSQRDREDAIQRFNNDRDCRVLIANQAAGGIGINLISSDLSIFYSKGFSLEQDLQAEGRNYRGGSEIHQKVTRIDIIAENTIDNLIAEALAAKQQISNSILEWRNKI